MSAPCHNDCDTRGGPTIDASGSLRSVSLTPGGTVIWGTRVPETAPGVYVISTPEPLDEAPIDADVLAGWIAARPEMRVDGERATVAALQARLRSFWIPGETIVYIGLAGTSLATRVGQFYRTPLGARAPHAGGHWIKTLGVLSDLRVTWATADDPDAGEESLLRAFGATISPAARRALPPGPVLPFANLETGDKVRKVHGITGSTAPRRSARVVSPPQRPRDPTTSTPPSTRSSRTVRSRADLPAINAAIQRYVAARPDRRATAVAVAAELDRREILRDSPTRSGKPLRDLMRAGLIDDAHQPDGRHWIIDLDRKGTAWTS